jgi:hypothetical protein
LHAVGLQSAELQIILLKGAFVEILRIVAPPFLVIACGERRCQIYMSVLKTVEKIGKDKEEIRFGGLAVDHCAVFSA